MSATASTSSKARTLLAAARPRRTTPSLRHIRALHEAPLSDAPSEPPHAPEDWVAFQTRRHQYKSLVSLFSDYGSAQTRDNTWQPHHSLHRPPAPRDLTLSALVAAGAHMGHHSSLMNPHFVPYAYGTRAGITVIDLDSTLPLLRRAASLIRAITARDGTVLFLGTRPDLKATVASAAARMGPHGFAVHDKWLGGTLSNAIVRHGPQHLENTRIRPDVAVILNPLQNLVAIRECAAAQVPTIGIVDSNVDPRIVMYPIPANDESTRTAELIAGVLSIAGREGMNIGREMRGEKPWTGREEEEDDAE